MQDSNYEALSKIFSKVYLDNKNNVIQFQNFLNIVWNVLSRLSFFFSSYSSDGGGRGGGEFQPTPQNYLNFECLNTYCALTSCHYY